MLTFKKIKELLKGHKILVAAAIIILAGGGYYLFGLASSSEAVTRYVVGTAGKDTLVLSVSGSGQVAASNQVDIKAEASGKIVSVLANQGQEVKSGQALAYLDSTNAQKAVRDAQTSLESAQLALEKLLAPVDKLTLMQAEDAVSSAKQTKLDAQEDLKNLADDEFNAITNSFLELPNIMSGLDSILFDKTISSSQWNLDYYADMTKLYDEKALQYRALAYDSYSNARAAYDKNFINYKAASRYSSASVIESLLDETYETEKSISEAIKNCNNLIQFYQDVLSKKSTQDPVALSNTHLTSLSSYTGKVNTHLTSLLSLQKKIVSYEKIIADSDRTIEEKQLALDNTREGAEEIEIKTQQLIVEGKENALLAAKEDLASCVVRAPFDGLLSSVEAMKGDTASSGGTLATIISQQHIAEITLNETDMASVKVGQKATLTFDAVEDLTLTGQVAQVDIVGTASQGVVSYTVKINFDTQDERIKPGMTVSAAIITESKVDILVVPSSAVKTQNGQSYILKTEEGNIVKITGSSQVALTAEPQAQAVEVGLANDSYTEITSGLAEGDYIITQTVSSSSNKTSTGSSSTKTSGAKSNVMIMSGITGGGPPN